MYSVGDLVVHPMHGAGVIDAIVQERIAGNVQDYYVFRMPVGGLVLKIPTENSGVIGIRSIVAPAEIERLIRDIPGMEVEQTANWNKRYRENLQRLKSGDLHEVARVVKSLIYRGRQKGLSTGERRMLHNAKQILLSEFVLVEQCDYDEALARIDGAMQ